MIETLPSGLYRVRVYSKSRCIATRSFKRKRDAAAWEDRQRAMLASGTWVNPRDASMPLADWMERWGATKGGAPNSVATREIMIRRHILPYFGSRPLATISPSDVEAWSQHLVTTVSAHTARQALVPLRQAFKLAVRDSIVVRDPTAGVRLPKSRPNEPVPLDHDQVWDLYDAAKSPRDAVMFVTMAYTGARWGEVSAMTTMSVRPTQVRLTHAYSEVSGHLHLGELKDHEARTVPLPSTVAKILNEWSRTIPRGQLLFQTSTGTPLRNRNFRRSVLAPALEGAGLPADITPHNFRDTAASLAIQAGASVTAVARMLGHEDASTTLKHYAGLFPDTFDGIASRMESEIHQVRRTSTDSVSDVGTDTTPTRGGFALKQTAEEMVSDLRSRLGESNS